MPETASVNTTVCLRNHDVRATVLLRAKDICEASALPAPFKTKDCTPYLEVHHRLPFAEQAPDPCANAIALCPNSHRGAHHGLGQERFRK